MRRTGVCAFVGALALAIFIVSAALAQPAPSARDESAAQPAPRIAPVPASEWEASVESVAVGLASLGMDNLVATYANHPVAAGALLPHLQYIWRESTLPRRHRALLSLRTLWLTRSEYLWSHRAALALAAEGLTPADLERIARGPDADGWTDFEATLIRAGDELVVDAFIADATWNALAVDYDIPQLVDTIDTVGALTMNAGIVNTLGIALEDGIAASLPTHIPYAVAAESTNIRLLGQQPRIPPDIPEGATFSANVFYTFRHHPPADSVRGAINTHVTGRATLDSLHREFLLVRIGVLCRSEYEYAAHVRVGRGAGMTDADLALILAGPEGPGSADAEPIKLALLRATDELHADDRVSASTWNVLAAEFDTLKLIDVLVSVGGYRSTSMLINSAGVQLDDNMADFRFPPELR